MKTLLILFCLFCCVASAQDTSAILEGRVTDPSEGSVEGAVVRVTNSATGYAQAQKTPASGAYHLSLPVGEYILTVEAANFGRYTRTGVLLNVSETVRIDVPLVLVRDKDTVTVNAESPLINTSSNEIGNVVTGRELVDLPLDGRNFTQLGLLQPGVAPITAGLAAAGGSLRGAQAYAVDGAAARIEQLPA